MARAQCALVAGGGEMGLMMWEWVGGGEVGLMVWEWVGGGEVRLWCGYEVRLGCVGVRWG